MLSIGCATFPTCSRARVVLRDASGVGVAFVGERDGVEVTVGIPDWTNDDASVADTRAAGTGVRVSRCACIWCPADESIRYSQFDNTKFGSCMLCVFVTWFYLLPVRRVVRFRDTAPPRL